MDNLLDCHIKGGRFILSLLWPLDKTLNQGPLCINAVIVSGKTHDLLFGCTSH